jgi:ubiquinone/menaquinone biosynthesis C-methylase UbiE
MNLIASRRIVEVGLARQVDVALADAVALPFPDASFDAAVATQVIEYVDNVEAALLEVRRVLRPGGRLVLLDTEWETLIWSSSDEVRRARILAAWSAHAAHPSLPRILTRRLRTAGFVVDELRVIPLLNTSYSEQTYSYNLAALIADFVKNGESLPSEDVEAWLADLSELDETAAYFFSLNRYLFHATRMA